MGKKVNPKVIRIGIIRTWPSRWFGGKDDYALKLKEDVLVRKFLTKHLRESGVDKVEISRNADKITIDVYTGKPGVIIGRGGQGVDDLKKLLRSRFLKTTRSGNININIIEVSRPNLSAQIVVQQMALEIEKRMPFRRVMKQALSRIERAGALGAKIVVKGRLNGAEIARSEKLSFGSVPLHTLRADVDYSRGVASTTYGAIGVKVWVNKGEIFDRQESGKGEVIGKSN